jgi:hypothetical protein
MQSAAGARAKRPAAHRPPAARQPPVTGTVMSAWTSAAVNARL